MSFFVLFAALDSNLAAFLIAIVFIVAMMTMLALTSTSPKSTKLAIKAMVDCFKSLINLFRF